MLSSSTGPGPENDHGPTEQARKGDLGGRPPAPADRNRGFAGSDHGEIPACPVPVATA